jgi:16S rRNA processing protein RimM
VQLVVGRIARAHGVSGEVAVDVRGPLTVRRTRWHAGRLLVCFDEVVDRTAAEALRGTMLVADSATSPTADDPDESWDHDLVGLAAVTVQGDVLGEVEDVLHPPGSDLLVVRGDSGAEILVPFVRAIVPEVDLRRRHLVVDPPDGLLDL